MTAVALALLRLAGAGLICGGLLALGGTGSRREILRFGCACLMVILVLDLLRQADALAAAVHTAAATAPEPQDPPET